MKLKLKFCLFYMLALRLVHTKNNYKNNDKNIVRKIALNIKEQQNPYHSYIEKRYSWNHFKKKIKNF